MFTYLETMLISLVHTLPLEAFVFIASFVEEVIAPIPSPTVMLVAGSVAQIQERALYALIPLILIGAVGKTIGALVVYAISDKAENLVMNKFGRFFGVTHDDVAVLQNKLGRGARDYVLLTVLRALPIMPSVLLSVGSGLLKIPLPLFIASTFLGTLVRDGVYLYAGYIGTEALGTFVSTSTHIESLVEIVVGVLVVLGVIYFIYKKKTTTAR
jgi:membrane protein DedA with SNARE-associated domain